MIFSPCVKCKSNKVQCHQDCDKYKPKYKEVLDACVIRYTIGWKWYGKVYIAGNGWCERVSSYSYWICRIKLHFYILSVSPYLTYHIID